MCFMNQMCKGQKQMVNLERNPGAESMNKGQGSPRARAQFHLRDGSRQIRKFDTSDLKQITDATHVQKNTEGARKEKRSKVLALPASNNLPPHLLMASLLEQLCFFMEPDRVKADQLFKILCERLSRLNIIAPLSQLDEMKSLRLQHRTNLTRIMRAAMFHLNNQSQSLLALPPYNPTRSVERPWIETDVIDAQTSRYRNEFEELERLGKGGFGSVYKARNYLDRTFYAVKKICFKQKNSELLKKLLREVKALASLQHPNIVGYNGAWMEYDSPLPFSAASSSNESPRTEDSVSVTDRDETQNNSFSIEFLNSDDDEDEQREDLNLFPGSGTQSIALAARTFSSIKTAKIEEITSVETVESKRNNLHISHQERLKIEVDESQSCSLERPHANPQIGCCKTDLETEHKSSEFVAEIVTGESRVKFSSMKTTHEEHCMQTFGTHDFCSTGTKETHTVERTEDQKKSDNRLIQWENANTIGILHGSSTLSALKQLIDHDVTNNSVSINNSDDIIFSTEISASGCAFEDNDFSVSTATSKFQRTSLTTEKASLLPPSSTTTSILKVPTDFVDAKGSFKNPSSYSGRRSKVKILSMEEDNDADVDCHEESKKDQDISPKRSQRRRHPSFQRSYSMNAASDFGGVVESKNHDYDIQNSITLYIQMELCSNTLAEWLEQRNQTLDTSTDYTDYLRRQNMYVFSQVLEGVDFIHCKGLIHRDLKPRNIFLSGQNLRVKIGDFGLAKEGVISPDCNEDSGYALRARAYSSTSDHTSGVGTSAYAAPEQLEGSFYDATSDIYSLGVILYEMFNIFITKMERALNIQNLRDGQCCPHFRKCWPQQASAVTSMTSKSPTERPSARHVLTSGLFLSSEQQVKILKQIVLEKDEALQEKDRMMAIKDKELMEKEKIIDQLRKQIDHLLDSDNYSL